MEILQVRRLSQNQLKIVAAIAMLIDHICAGIYYMYSGEIYGNVLITFSLSMVALYVTEILHKVMSGKEIIAGIYSITFLACLITMIWTITRLVYIDYGIIGVFLPVFAEAGGKWINMKNRYSALMGFSIGVLLLALNLGGIQYFGLMAVPLLFLYNGERGSMKLKNFFYWFYPVHLAAIGMLSMAI